ncbi:MAG TPA: Zn-dependent hydrolase, partial [Bryobacteraceae bacterium]
MSLNPQRTISELKELRELTSDANGAQRVAWTPMWLCARSWFEEKLRDLPVEYHFDAAGNRWITLKSESPKTLLIGGHLDSVPNGGWLDGSLGVLTGLEILRRFADQYNGRPPVTVRLIDWADEEGARFGRSLLGSSAFAGTHSIDADRGRKDQNGIRLEEAVESCGFDIERFPEASLERKEAAAYIELHIEQGPVLERLGLPLAAVLGTKGVERWTVTFLGQEAHSGSTPMNARKDALAAAAKLALEIRPIARKHTDAVCTMGSVKTFPGIVTAVVGRCETTVDQRDLDPATLAQMYREAREASERFAKEENCTVEWSKIWSIEPVPFHAALIDLCEEAIR